MHNRLSRIRQGALGVTLAFAASLGPLPAVAKHPVNITDAKLVAVGKAVFAKNCVKCHGIDLKGPEVLDFTKLVPPRLDALSGHVAKHDDTYLFNRVARGTRDKAGLHVEDGMPVFQNKLKPEEIWAALTYIKSRWPRDVYRKQHRQNSGHGAAPKSRPHGHN